MRTYDAIVVGGGRGERSALGYNKVLHSLDGQPVFAYAMATFLSDPRCKRVIAVLSQADATALKAWTEREKVIVTRSGNTRSESVGNGLTKTNEEFVLVHDGARPFVEMHVVDRVVEALNAHPSVTPSVNINDTLKRVESGKISGSVSRESLQGLQTPQGFWRETLIKAYARDVDAPRITCDVSRVGEALGIAGVTVKGHTQSMKLTTPDDIMVLEAIARAKNRS